MGFLIRKKYNFAKSYWYTANANDNEVMTKVNAEKLKDVSF